MPQSDNPTNFARFSGFFIFLVMVMSCFSWFTWSIYNIVMQITSASKAVYFDKGSLYMLGAGISLAALTFGIFYEGILRRILTKQIAKYITRAAVIGISLMFIFPHLLHYPINQYLTKNGYVICTKISYQWLLYKKIVYTNGQHACDALVREKEITKSSSGR